MSSFGICKVASVLGTSLELGDGVEGCVAGAKISEGLPVATFVPPVPAAIATRYPLTVLGTVGSQDVWMDRVVGADPPVTVRSGCHESWKLLECPRLSKVRHSASHTP